MKEDLGMGASRIYHLFVITIWIEGCHPYQFKATILMIKVTKTIRLFIIVCLFDVRFRPSRQCSIFECTPTINFYIINTDFNVEELPVAYIKLDSSIETDVVKE